MKNVCIWSCLINKIKTCEFLVLISVTIFFFLTQHAHLFIDCSFQWFAAFCSLFQHKPNTKNFANDIMKLYFHLIYSFFLQSKEKTIFFIFSILTVFFLWFISLQIIIIINKTRLLIFNYFNFYIIFEHSMNNNNKQKKILGWSIDELGDLSLFFLFLHCFFLSFLSLAPCFLCVILFLFLNSLSLFFVLQAFDETIENDATQQFVCKRLNSFFF